MSDAQDDDQFWLRVSDNKVVRASEARADERIGPYATEEDAKRGLEELHERERRKQAEDDTWNG